MSDWNQKVIDEFRANEGRVGGQFAGRPLLLLHHVGRKSGREFVSPLVYLAGDDDDVVYVIASKGGAPTHPEWYRNLLTAGKAKVEVGTGSYEATVRDLPADERDRVFTTVVERFPGFGDYAVKTEGIRTIPVLELTRVG
jgi:deazaflavin-dependent oxidoreductase (nitroreductase family)